MQIKRVANIRFNKNTDKNGIDKMPATGADFGKTDKGPFSKNFVNPNEPANKLRVKVITGNVSKEPPTSP